MLVHDLLRAKIIKNPGYVVVHTGVEGLSVSSAAHPGTQTGDADHEPSRFAFVCKDKWSTCGGKETLETDQI